MKLRTSFIGDVFALCKRYIIIAVLTLVVVSCGQVARAQALKIGDTIPDAVWNTPLQVTNHPEGKTSITLNEYKGKLIILDFWATWCSPCVAAFPKMDSLQREFGSRLAIVPVSRQEEKTVSTFLAGLKRTKGVSTYSVIQDTALNRYFFHTQIPHYVWLYQDRVWALTDGDGVNSREIGKVLQGGEVQPAERGTVRRRFDETQSLHAAALQISSGKVMGYQTLTGHLEGLQAYTKSDRDENGGRRIIGINLSLQQLYKLAYSRFDPELIGNNTRTLLETRDSVKLFGPNYQTAGKEAWRKWYRENTYCYELAVAASEAPQIWEKMQASLSQSFPMYSAAIEPRQSKCLILVRDKEKPVLTTTGKAEAHHDDKYTFYMRNKPWALFRNRLQAYYLQAKLPLVDETGITGKVDLSISADLSDIGQLNHALSRYGISIVEAERPLDFIVVRDVR